MELLTRQELAQILRCEEQTIKYYVASRQLPFIMIGKEARFLKESILEWLKSRELSPNSEIDRN